MPFLMSVMSAEPHADEESCQSPVHTRGTRICPSRENSLGGGIEGMNTECPLCEGGQELYSRLGNLE